jgi:hypothetical protein
VRVTTPAANPKILNDTNTQTAPSIVPSAKDSRNQRSTLKSPLTGTGPVITKVTSPDTISISPSKPP